MTDARLFAHLRDRRRLLDWQAAGDEDAVQEGRIAVWRALEKRPDATPSYLDQAAKWRIKSIQRGESFTGEVRKHGGKDTLPDPLRANPEPIEAAHEVPAEESDARDLAAHAHEIHAAVWELPEAYRNYVLLRFWSDANHLEIGKVLGRSPRNLATTWRTQIKPILADRLAHLASMV